MNELKPEDVMRALECCRDNDEEDTCKYCKECPSNDAILVTEEGDCMYDMYTAAIECIREQSAEIERLNKLNEDLYKEDCEFIDAAFDNLKRYREMALLNKSLKANNSKCYGLGYADGISKLAEKLIGRFNVCDKAMYSQTTVHDVIARVAKELKEKYNERDNA